MDAPTVLIIGLQWPEPKATAAGCRMMELIMFFLEMNYKVSFGSTAKKTSYSADLEQLEIETFQLVLNHTSFDDLIKKINPKIVFFDRFITEEQFGWRVAEYASDALRILDTEDLHSLRLTRGMAKDAAEDFNCEHWKQHELTKREIASIYRCDLSLIISTFEIKLLQEELNLPPSLLFHLPFMLATLNTTNLNSWLPYEERHHFVFVGTGKHTPNTDAILWLKNEIWPLIKQQLPEAKINIYGAYLPEIITSLNSPKTGFMVHGWIDNIALEMGKAKVNLAPLRFGAGVKGKIIQAMNNGTPNVTTPIGAEGISDSLVQKSTLHLDPKAFADMAVRVYSDKKLWSSLQLEGITTINENFNRESLHNALKMAISNLQKHKNQLRRENFVGGMLMHHTTASSKYLAKWIASKNKDPQPFN